MLPLTLLQQNTRLDGDRVVPRYLTERDHGWLNALLDEHGRFEGRKRSELTARLASPLVAPAPRAKLRLAVRVLEAWVKDRADSAMPSHTVRWRVFRAAAANDGTREEILRRVAEEESVAPADLEAALFADLRGERRVPALPPDVSPFALSQRANLEIVSSLLRHAATVRITAFGDVSNVVRHARRLGLICVVQDATRAARRKAANDSESSVVVPSSGVAMDVSGPLALFHHTQVYGRALASLVPRLGACEEFELVARCALGRGKYLFTFELRSGDPIGVGDAPSRSGDRIEDRFARDFRRGAPDWDLIPAPDPVDARGVLLFPDFEIVDRRRPTRRWYLEIIRFWTADYMKERLARWTASGIGERILCVDAGRNCLAGDPPEDARIIHYRSKIEVPRILAILER